MRPQRSCLLPVAAGPGSPVCPAALPEAHDTKQWLHGSLNSFWLMLPWLPDARRCSLRSHLWQRGPVRSFSMSLCLAVPDRIWLRELGHILIFSLECINRVMQGSSTPQRT